MVVEGNHLHAHTGQQLRHSDLGQHVSGRSPDTSGAFAYDHLRPCLSQELDHGCQEIQVG
jgi:hypothetical protein